MINKVTLIGNLGADPETRTTNSGLVIASLRIATTERKKEGDGWVDHTEWHRVTCFGRTAENAAKYLKKGRQVYVEGKLRTTKFQDKETGKDRYSTEVVADELKFLGGNPDRAEGGGRSDSGRSSGGSSGGATQQNGGGWGSGSSSQSDEDIPF